MTCSDIMKEIEAIIYDATTNLPFSVFTEDAMYDFDWCRIDGVLAFRNTGSPGPYINRGYRGSYKIWIKAGIRVREDCGKERTRCKRTKHGVHRWRDAKYVTRRTMFRRGYTPIKNPIQYNGNPNPFEHPDADEGEYEWCAVCECLRYLYWPGEPECEHLIWCEKHGCWGGPGGTDCKCQNSVINQ